MSSTTDHSLQTDRHREIDASWFEAVREKYTRANVSNALISMTGEEIEALQAYYNQSANAEESALKITHPVSTSPVSVSTDETLPLRTLWYILWEGLVSWPSSRVPDLLALLSAIGQLPKTVQIHNGELTDAETGTRPLTWAEYPYFYLIWSESTEQPGDYVLQQARQGGTDTALDSAKSEYIYLKDIEAQLIARGILTFGKQTVEFISKTLETEPDSVVPQNDAEAYEQNRLEFQIPVVASLMKYCGTRLMNRIVQQSPDQQIWSRWKESLGQIAESESDTSTRSAASAALVEMQRIET